jgi:pimeloyl-ACP methyl ester carboxylesterase
VTAPASPVDPGCPIVLLHGQPGARSDWDAVVGALPARLATLALDRPGYRQNPRPPGGFDYNARWLLDELDRLGHRQAVLVGHSYGGGIALAAAELAPERVRGIVLIASVGPGCLDGWDKLLAAPVTGPICAVTAWSLTPWFARRRIARLVRLRERPLEPHEHLNWEAWGNARHEHGAMWRTFLLEERELVTGIDRISAGLERITAPTLIIADPADRMIPIATAHALHDRVPGARLVLLEGGGHHPPRRVPQVIAAELAGFMATLA